MESRLHASCVAIDGRALLITGPSGSGKSDLALRLVDRGATLVSDDQTVVAASGSCLIAAPPANIAGLIEVRHIGIIHMAHATNIPIALVITLEEKPERMPDQDATIAILDVAVPRVALAGCAPSTPIKAELALRQFGLKLV